MTVITATSSLLTGVRLELGNKRQKKQTEEEEEGGVFPSASPSPSPSVVEMGRARAATQRQSTTRTASFPHLSFTKPSWVVRTESNVRKEIKKPPDPPCVVCRGSGRVDCHHCSGLGRTNCVHLTMLPIGEWPKWCRTCGGSGLDYCSRCLGTGEYRYTMGFHFMNMDSDDSEHNSTGTSEST